MDIKEPKEFIIKEHEINYAVIALAKIPAGTRINLYDTYGYLHRRIASYKVDKYVVLWKHINGQYQTIIDRVTTERSAKSQMKRMIKAIENGTRILLTTNKMKDD